MYKLLKKPMFGRFMVKWQNPLTPESQKEWQKIQAKSKTGGTIYGLFAKAVTDQEKATIVLGHPMGKEAKGYFLKNGYTQLLRENGFNTLIFDINGFGESTNGNFSYFEDILAIGNEALKLTPHLPIGYFGISLGGQWATVSFAYDTHPFEFAIVESAATTLEDFWIKYPIPYKLLKAFYFFFPKYKKEYNMQERIKEAKKLKSLLLIYSKSDDIATVAMGRVFHNNSPVPTELWTVENANHASLMKSKHKAEYENKIVSFFNSQTGN